MPGEGSTAREQLGIKSWIRIIFVCSLPAAVLDWENKQVLLGQTQDRFYGLWTKFGIFEEGGGGRLVPAGIGRRCNWTEHEITSVEDALGEHIRSDCGNC